MNYFLGFSKSPRMTKSPRKKCFLEILNNSYRHSVNIAFQRLKALSLHKYGFGPPTAGTSWSCCKDVMLFVFSKNICTSVDKLKVLSPACIQNKHIFTLYLIYNFSYSCNKTIVIFTSCVNKIWIMINWKISHLNQILTHLTITAYFCRKNNT